MVFAPAFGRGETVPQEGGEGVSIAGSVSESRRTATGTGHRAVCAEDAPSMSGAPVLPSNNRKFLRITKR